MKQIITLFAISIFSINCDQQQKSDILVFNAQVYTMDEDIPLVTAFVIDHGRIIDLGSVNELRDRYLFSKEIDVENRFIYPGFIDAHCHFYGLGSTMQEVNLMGSESFNEVIERIVDFQKKNALPYITGRGWDHEDWEIKEFPTNDILNEKWPNIPVIIRRVDGHAALANQKALSMANISDKTKIEGGAILKENGKLTGILIDNAVDIALSKVIPDKSVSYISKSLIDAEKITLSYGLTTLSDAGLDFKVIDVIDSLQHNNVLKTRIYAMVSVSDQNIEEIKKRGAWFKDKLQVNSVKFYLDGALGSRGACLTKPYDDQKGWSGFLLNSKDAFERTATEIAALGMQLNTHCIGDSANRIAINTYEKHTRNTDLRWRIEHAQVVNSEDFKSFKNPNIIPSVQPTHATSDMYWAEKRLGASRIKDAYAYKKLLNIHGKIALGTDFPVEKVNPFLTFYAAVGRQDIHGYPEQGFQIENALSREEALKDMTIWAAYANHQEKNRGSLSKGKWADFIVLDIDLMNAPLESIPQSKVIQTFIAGEEVYQLSDY